ncbi:MAG TPA: NAD(P) transhydrogenase subunit alpha [Longimicrobiales bacterium]
MLTQFLEIYVFILAAFVGYAMITRIPPLLHTPLMSATNAISGISLVGSLVAAGADYGTTANILGAVAVLCATINVVGGFMITERMLRMFRSSDAGRTRKDEQA